MNGELAAQFLRERSRSTLWWAAGVAAIVLLTVGLYPSVRGAEGLNDYAKDLPEALRGLFAGGELDLTSPAGYLNSQLFAVTAPLLLLIFGIGAGAAAVAGDEEAGMMDLVLAQPVERGRLVAERILALLVLCTALGAAMVGATLLGAWLVDMEIGAGRVALAGFSSVLLGGLFGVIAVAVGSLVPGRGRAIAISAGLAIFSWLLDGLGRAVDFLEPWRPLSPFYQLIGVNPLRDGIPWSGWATTTLAMLVTGVLAAVALERRDLR